MKEITLKLRKEAFEPFKPFLEQLQKEGATQEDLEWAIHKHRAGIAKKYYREKLRPRLLGEIAKKLEYHDMDSKIEYIFYRELQSNKIDFKVQYKIGPHKVDFLINDFLVVEIDGPHHEVQEQIEHDKKRDKYMRKMGYKVLRVPVWVLSVDINAVMDEIKEIIN